MGKFCTNCGSEVKEHADVCLSCGKLVNRVNPNSMQYNYNNYSEPVNVGKPLATVSVVFGSLGFYPLIFIGSIVGLIASIVGLIDSKNEFKGRSKVGLGLSVGSALFWITLFVLIGNGVI